MRVTNAMLSNNMILGLNKNMNKLNTLYDQMNSLKKIQRPSDDPIILGRSLKLRLNVLETEQYKVNVGEARSWMEISEGSINNTQGILNDIRLECAQAANGTLDTEDRHKIMTTVEQLKKQLIQESNANYAGRNVFAGYKTDQKVLFDKDQEMDPPVKFVQEFTQKDIETVTYREEEYYRIRLPYGGIDAKEENFVIKTDNPDQADITVTTIDSTKMPSQDPLKSYYHPAENQAYFMRDTGELILNKANQADIGTLTLTYHKSTFKEGEPNPDVFFESELQEGQAEDADPKIYHYTRPKKAQSMEYEIGIGTKMDINVLGKDLFDAYSLRDIDELVHVLGSYEDVETAINFDGPVDPDKAQKRSHKETINLSKMFSSGIGKMDTALKSVSRQLADLGSRMKRLELTEKRLGDDEISYTDLLSKTEDVELERAYIDFNTQYAVYQSALQVTAKVVQPTLMDFLR